MIKQIYQEGVVQVVPTNSGIVFAVKQSGSTYDDYMKIAYRMYSCDSGETSVVTRNVFLLSKFGNNFAKVENNPKEFIESKTVSLSDHSVLIVDSKGDAELINFDGRIKWKGNLCYKECIPEALYATEEGVWVSYKKEGAIIRYSPLNMRPEIRIGGNGQIKFPEGIWAEGNRVLVCTTGDNSVLEIDAETFKTKVYQKFNGTPHNYYKIGANEIVLLDSGLYRL